MTVPAQPVQASPAMWLRPFEQALRLSHEVHAIMAEYGR
jgi:hypothetical protein